MSIQGSNSDEPKPRARILERKKNEEQTESSSKNSQFEVDMELSPTAKQGSEPTDVSSSMSDSDEMHLPEQEKKTELAKNTRIVRSRLLKKENNTGLVYSKPKQFLRPKTTKAVQTSTNNNLTQQNDGSNDNLTQDSQVASVNTKLINYDDLEIATRQLSQYSLESIQNHAELARDALPDSVTPQAKMSKEKQKLSDVASKLPSSEKETNDPNTKEVIANRRNKNSSY